ncbi:MAG: ATP-binding protein [Cyanobacteria bacterium P01_E01_bin.42]
MMTNSDRVHWYQENWQTLQQEIERIRQLLERHIAGESEGEASANIWENSALARLVEKFYLSPFEKDILLLCAGIEIDPALLSLCDRLAGNSSQKLPTLSLALSVFPEARWSVLSPQSALQHWQLIEFAPGSTLTQTPMRIDKRILCYLLGETAWDEQLAGIVQFPVLTGEIGALPPSQSAIAEGLMAIWDRPSDRLPLVQLCGTDFNTKSQIVTFVCETLGLNLATMSATVLPLDPRELHHLRKRWEREAILSDRVLWLHCDVVPTDDLPRNTAISRFVENLDTPLILSVRDRLHLQERAIASLDIPDLSYEEQKNLWETHLGSTEQALNGSIDRLVTQFNLNSRDIRAACWQLDPQKEVTLERQLWNFCRTQARPRLEDLAQRIESRAAWDDLIVPDREKKILQAIATQVSQRATVYEQWGFAPQERRGLGIAALFAGASGTGKTMAAGVLARELNLDLYRIDLSTVVSKYVGETEKNLSRIFAAAETGGAILLFDEADALFGKRSEVKSSHDRYANIEVSYLLQRMEAYRGLAILTTNLKSAIDRAFLRRLRFIVNFPFPKAEQRREIWRRIFPSQTPTKGLKFELLGNLSSAGTGGNIRNIALNAAFLAADAGESVQMKHILEATKRECQKLEVTLTDREIRGWV